MAQLRIAKKENRVGTRPQDLDPSLLVARRRINTSHLSCNPKHPFYDEITKWKPSPSIFLPKDIIDDKKLTYIDTTCKLQEAVSLISKSNLIAVDREGNFEDSYVDMTCLIQISTEKDDFIIDALKLHSAIHEHLMEIFQSIRIVKLFHDARADITCFQRDFNIFPIAVLDTQEIYNILFKMPKISLAHMVAHVCDITLDKKYQLTDWRIRPLPDELINYARLDSQLLLAAFQAMLRHAISVDLDLNTCVFPSSLKSTKYRYSYPKRSIEKCFEKAMRNLTAEQRGRIIYKEEQFVSVSILIDSLARIADVPRDKMLSPDQICLLLLNTPSSVQELNTKIPQTNEWAKEDCEQLLEELKRPLNKYSTQMLHSN